METPSSILSPELLQAQATVLSKLQAVEQALTTADPLLPHHCEAIHKQLKEHEELVHVLTDDQIRVFMAGMKKYKNVMLVQEATKKSSRGKVTADDL